MHRFIIAATLTLALASPTLVRAESSSDKALAQSLFDAAKKLMKEGKYAEACPKLAESHRLDPAGGTLLNLAVCHEKEGRIATAWAEFNDALSQAKKEGRADREGFAREHIGAIEPRLSRLVVNVAPAAASTNGLTVKIDGVAIGKAAWGMAMPVDPGKHAIEASAPGKKPRVSTVEVGAEADKKSIDVAALDDAPVETKAVTTTTPVTDTGSSKKTIGFVVGGVGVVALGVGAVFGITAFSKWGERNDNCPNDVCNAKAKEAGDSARSAANIANVGVGVGIVAIGVGTYLILSSPSAERTASSSSKLLAKKLSLDGGALPGGAFLGLSGVF